MEIHTVRSLVRVETSNGFFRNQSPISKMLSFKVQNCSMFITFLKDHKLGYLASFIVLYFLGVFQPI